MLSWRLAALCTAWSTCEQCVKERSKTIVQGGVSRECLVILLNIATGHDPREAFTHLLQAAAGDSIYLCASSHPDLRTASLIASSTRAKEKTLTIRSILLPTDVTLRNAIFHTKQCLRPCAHTPSADPRAPLELRDRFPSPQKRSGHETNSYMPRVLHFSDFHN